MATLGNSATATPTFAAWSLPEDQSVATTRFDPRRKWRELWIHVVGPGFLLLTCGLSFAQTVQHVYDENGRLTGTIAPTGDAARWTYDATGNITKIDRFTATQVSIIEFTPNAGPGGSVITILGSGFSATPSQNTVTFNGVAATVSAATANKLTVTAPASATTGVVAVTSPNGSGTSLTNFTVAPNPAAPTITGFSPAVGLPGGALTVIGTNLPTNLADSTLRLNRNLAAVGAATSTQFTSTIPASTSSGKVSVTTAAGTATSATDLFVVPSGYAAANVEYTDRTTVGGADKVIPFSSAGKIGLLLFEANQMDKLRIRIVSTTNTNGGMSLLSPDSESVFGSVVSGSLPLTFSARDYITPFLGKTGDFTLLLAPGTIGTTTIGIDRISQSLVLDGPGVDYDWTNGSNRKGAFLLDVPENTGFSVGMVVNSFPAGSLNLEIQAPLGGSLATSGALSPGMSGVVVNAVAASEGVHSLVISQGMNTNVGDTVLWLSRDVLGTITPNGAPVTFTTARPGQRGSYSFSGAAGQRISVRVQVPSGSFASGGSVQVRRADGSTILGGFPWTSNSDAVFDFATLPATETYSVLFTPTGALVGNATLTLVNAITGPIAIDGAIVNFANAIGQYGRYDFSGMANQNLGLGFVVNSISAGANVSFRVRRPSDGISIYSGNLAAPGTSGLSLDLIKLPETGTYFIEVDPVALATVSGSLTLSADAVIPITSGVPATFSVLRPGRNGRHTFSANSGQQVKVDVAAGSTIAGGGSMWLVTPGGTTLTSFSFGSVASSNTNTLNASGTWTLFVTPATAALGNVTFTLTVQ